MAGITSNFNFDSLIKVLRGGTRAGSARLPVGSENQALLAVAGLPDYPTCRGTAIDLLFPRPMDYPQNQDYGASGAREVHEGALIDHFRVQRKIGEGGMGEVWLAHDVRLQRDVALKFLAPALEADPENLKRFEREARAAAGLQHPNIVAVHEVGRYGRRPFISMAYVDGRPLSSLLKQAPVPIERILAVALQIGHGLAAAHDQGITHRDLKPENVLIDDSSNIHLLDFGLAFVGDSGDVEKTVTKMTSAGVAVGTVPYMAPEQLSGKPITPRVDIFALGVMLYELITGQRPFKGSSAAETAASILRDRPAAPDELRPDTPYDLVRIVTRCLQKDPDRRFQSIRDVTNELVDLRDLMAMGKSQTKSAILAVVPPQSLEEREFSLTSEIIRRLDSQSPKMIGDRLVYLDNQVDSDVLVIHLHAWGLDHRSTVAFLTQIPVRAVAPTLYGFDENSRNRLPLSLKDHTTLFRALFREINEQLRPKYVVLSGFSSGADHVVRIATEEDDPGVRLDGIVPFGANVSLKSCFISSRFADLPTDRGEVLLDTIKSIGNATGSLAEWLKFHEYMITVFSKFGSNTAPLRAFAADIVEPFRKNDWRQFALWYRMAILRIPHVRFVVDADDSDVLDLILDHHLKENVLGDGFREGTIVLEDIPHIVLASPDILMKHTMAVVDEIRASRG